MNRDHTPERKLGSLIRGEVPLYSVATGLTFRRYVDMIQEIEIEIRDNLYMSSQIIYKKYISYKFIKIIAADGR